MDGVKVAPYRLLGGLRHTQSLNNLSSIPCPRKNYWSSSQQKHQVHGFQGSNESLHQSDEFADQQTYDNYESSNEDFAPKFIKPFHNNPPLSETQRGIVGNNFYLNTPSQVNNWNNINNEQLDSLMLYREALKQNLTTSNRSARGFPKMRYGRIGGHWHYIKQTNTYSGSNLLFIDGTVRTDDNLKNSTPRFGYSPQNRLQPVPSSSFHQDQSSNLVTKSLDNMTWSATDQLNCRPSLSQYSNRYERHAKDGFTYWPTDLAYKKPRCKPGTTGTYKRWLGLSDSILKL